MFFIFRSKQITMILNFWNPSTFANETADQVSLTSAYYALCRLRSVVCRFHYTITLHYCILPKYSKVGTPVKCWCRNRIKVPPVFFYLSYDITRIMDIIEAVPFNSFFESIKKKIYWAQSKLLTTISVLFQIPLYPMNWPCTSRAYCTVNKATICEAQELDISWLIWSLYSSLRPVFKGVGDRARSGQSSISSNSDPDNGL